MENKIKVPNKIPCPKCRSGNRLDMDTDYYKYRYTCTACGFSCFGRDLKNEYRKEAELKIKLTKNAQPEPRQNIMPDEPRNLYQGEDRSMCAVPREADGSMV